MKYSYATTWTAFSPGLSLENAVAGDRGHADCGADESHATRTGSQAQYSCYLPIDASAAKLTRTYLALYAAEGRVLDLAKARALGDAMVNNQDESGRIRTYWIPEAGDTGDPLAGVVPSPLGGDWYNCMAEDKQALAELAGARSGIDIPH